MGRQLNIHTPKYQGKDWLFVQYVMNENKMREAAEKQTYWLSLSLFLSASTDFFVQ